MRTIWSCIAAACLKVVSATAGAEVTRVTIAVETDDSVRVTYGVPPTCRRLMLKEASEAAIDAESRRRWKSVNSCGLVSGVTLSFHDPRHCFEQSFVVAAQPTISDRIYPQAFPVAKRAFILYSDYFVPSAACGAVEVELKASPGTTVAADGVLKTSTSLRFSPTPGAGFWMYLGSEPLATVAGVPIVIGDELPVWVTRELAHWLPGLLKTYGLSEAGRQPSVIVVAGANTGRAQPQVQADVTRGRFIRFGLFDFRDAVPTDHLSSNLVLTLAHELAHFLQPALADVLLSEGGAEFLGLAGAVSVGAVDAAFVKQYLTRAINDCLLLGAGMHYAELAGSRGRTPYACGLALHLAAYADAARMDQFASPLAWLTQRYQEIDQGVVPLLLGAGSDARSAQANVAMLLTERLKASGLLLAPTEEPDEKQESALRRELLARIMRDDCAGIVSYFIEPDRFVVGNLSRPCGAFREGQSIVGVEGQGFFSSAENVWSAATRACNTRGSVRRDVAGGGMTEPRCRPLPPRPQLIAGVSDRAYALLSTGSAPVSRIH